MCDVISSGNKFPPFPSKRIEHKYKIFSGAAKINLLILWCCSKFENGHAIANCFHSSGLHCSKVESKLARVHQLRRVFPKCHCNS